MGDFLQSLGNLANTIIPDLQRAGVFGQQAQVYAYLPTLTQQQATLQRQQATTLNVNYLSLAIVAGVIIVGIAIVFKVASK